MGLSWKPWGKLKFLARKDTCWQSVLFCWHVMNPSYLQKDRLLYELGLRGITSVADIQTPRKLFRSVALRDLPVELSYLR
jgi:hypothetical protein